MTERLESSGASSCPNCGTSIRRMNPDQETETCVECGFRFAVHHAPGTKAENTDRSGWSFWSVMEYVIILSILILLAVLGPMCGRGS